LLKKDFIKNDIYKSKNDNIKLGLAKKVMMLTMMVVVIISLMALKTVKDVDSVKSLLLMRLIRRKFRRV